MQNAECRMQNSFSASAFCIHHSAFSSHIFMCYTRKNNGGSPLPPINGSDTAWLLVSTALVLMMTPALGFFYGGMVRAKNALNTLMMSFSALGFVGLAWAFLGYSVAFGHASAWCGGGEFFFLRGVGLGAQGTIPHILFFAYQGTFAIITAAMISGAIVERSEEHTS